MAAVRTRYKHGGSLMRIVDGHPRRHKIAQAVALAIGLACVTAARAQTDSFNVPAQDAATAIPEFARQANLQIIAPADKLNGVRAHAVTGSLDARAALKELLQGTGLVVASDDGHTISLRFIADTQTTPQSAGNNSSAESLGEITITALRYKPVDQSSATGLQMKVVDTPQAISVVTSNMMQVIGAQNIAAGTDLVPGAIYFGTGFGYDRIELRGVPNTYQMVDGIETDVLRLAVDNFALDRTEVVRGPATALYGVTGSFGGEINSVLKSPLLTPQVEAGFEIGSFDTKRYSLDVTGPLAAGALAGRLVVKADDYGPGLDNSSIRDHHEMLLGSLAWTVSDATNATIWWYHDNRNIDPYDQGPLFLVDGQLALPPSNINPLQWYFSNPNESTEHTEFDLILADLAHTFSNEDWQFKADALYSRYEQQINYFYPFGPFGAYGAGSNNVDIYTYDITRHNGELTVELSLRGAFELFGRKQRFMAQYEGDDTTYPGVFTLLNSVFVGTMNAYQGGGYNLSNGSPIPYVNEGLIPLREIEQTDFKDDKLSLQMLLSPADRLQFLLGVMFQHGSTETRIPIEAGQVLSAPLVEGVDYNEVMKRLGVVYDLIQDRGAVDNLNAYVNYSQGFQPQIIVNKQAVAQYFPQLMTQYEGGLKAEFLNHRLGGSVAVYNYDISNVAAGDTPIGQFGVFGSTVADGHQKATGVEAEVVGEILPGWNIAANYAYSDIRLTNPAYAYDLPIENVPKQKGTITSSYEFVEGPLQGFRVGGMFVRSGDYALVQGFPTVVKWGEIYYPGYTRFDLNASYKFHGGWNGLELYLNARNIFNHEILFSKEGTPSFSNTFEDPRALYVGLRYKFPTK